MNDTDHRKKMISLRLTEVDYELLKAQYRTYGVRNVSDLARLALQRLMKGTFGSQDPFAAKLAELDERVRNVETQLSVLTERKK
jgi:hypothetical protein